MTFAVSIDNISKTYRGKRFAAVTALSELSLHIKPGEVFGFLGPNGAGKSTTIKTLLGLIRPDRGSVSIFGAPVTIASTRMKIGYLPENPAFYDFLTADEFLNFVGKAYSMAVPLLERRKNEVLEQMGLSQALKRPIRSYSKGMVQRLGLAQALLHDPDLYVLDEPMSGLDPLGRALVKDIILNLKRRGKTVFFSTHVTADAEHLCDRIGVIVHGCLQDEQVVEDLLRNGVDGYVCRVRAADRALLSTYEVEWCGAGEAEIFIDRDEFDAVASRLLSVGISFSSIEPRRHDIEDYFLRLVADAEK